MPLGVGKSCHQCLHFSPPPSASAEINTVCQSCFAGALPNMPLVGSLSVYLRWPSSRWRQGIVLAWHNTVHSRGSDHLCLKSLFSGAQLELVLNLLCLQHQGSVRGSLPTAFFPGCLCQLQGPCEVVRCLSVADSLFHIFI